MPGVGIVHVGIVWRDVEVACHQQPRPVTRQGRQPVRLMEAKGVYEVLLNRKRRMKSVTTTSILLKAVLELGVAWWPRPMTSGRRAPIGAPGDMHLVVVV